MRCFVKFFFFFPALLSCAAKDLLNFSVSYNADDPCVFEETTLNFTFKNEGEEPFRLLDRFSRISQNECFMITVKNSEGKFVISNASRPFVCPRPIKYKTLMKGAKMTVPVKLGDILYDSRLPIRHVLKSIKEEETYTISASYYDRDPLTGAMKKSYSSELSDVRFKKSDKADYKVVASMELSAPFDLSTYKLGDDGELSRLNIDVSIPATGVSIGNDEVEVQISNSWDQDIKLWKLFVEDGEKPSDASLTFIACLKDGTPVSNVMSSGLVAYDSKYDVPVAAGDSVSFTLSLSKYLPERLFAKDAEYYLIARYDNRKGTGCLQGIWYSNPVKIQIKKPN